MALSIVAQAPAAPDSVPGITKSSRWSCDIYTGQSECLIAAGLLTLEQLTPQQGRTPGYTAFLPTGEPCPIHLRTWREPGFKAIREQEDGSYSVEITVAKDVQLWRRRAEKAARDEAERARITQRIAEGGDRYRNWRFRQSFDGGCERWEGTKAQLQAAGLGMGMKFPGEPGAAEEVNFKCPLGFDFRVYLPRYDPAKVAAGIYIADSRYLPRTEAPKQYVPQAPGVLREVWTPESWSRSNCFHGTAEALVRAGIVPDIRFFPGQPGQAKVQASFRKDWTLMSTANGQPWGATIRKRGKSGQYVVDVPVTEAEEERRENARRAREENDRAREQVLAAERKKLREGAPPERTPEEFRAERTKVAKFWSEMLWKEVFAKADGRLSFNIPKDSDLWEELAEAFATIRRAVEEADILGANTPFSSAQTGLKLVSVRQGKGLQSVLGDATRLRLVHSAPDNLQG